MSFGFALVDVFGERGKTGATGYSHIGVGIGKELETRGGIQRAD